jgi:ABC-type transport system substrate-binding protein
MLWIRAASIVLALACAGCPAMPDGPRYRGHGSMAPRRGGTLMLADEARVRTLDPQVATDSISQSVIEMLFEPLYSYDHEMHLVPHVASALPEVSADGLVFSVPIRGDIHFQSGRLLTPDDVVYTFERMLAPETGSSVAPLYAAIDGFDEFRDKRAAHVRGITRQGDRLEVRLTKPDQSFLHLLAMRPLSPVARENVEALGAEFGRRPMGTGPFRLVSWDAGVRLVLERNLGYHKKGLPYLDRVVFQEGVSSDTGFLRFRNGQLDIVTRMTPADRALLNSSQKWRPYVEKSATIDVWALFMNCEIAPFTNVHVRRAVAFAIDRERWAKARSGSLAPSGQIVPPALVGYDPNLPNLQRFDPARARQELVLAGFPNGLPEPVTMWVGDQPKSRLYGALAQADLAKVGIPVELKPVSFPIYLASTATRGRVQMFAGGWIMDYPDPSNFLALLHSRGIAAEHSNNKAFYANPELDKLLDAALVERDAAKRAAMYRQANDLVAHDAPWAIFANQSVPQAWQPYVHGYRPHPVSWLPVNEVWLDLPRERIARAVLLGQPLAAASSLRPVR